MPFSNCFRLVSVFLFLFLISSCKPTIHTFRVSPLVITGDQKVLIDFDAKGTPALEFNEHLSTDSVQLLEFTLVVTKAGKEARKTIQVQKLKSQSPLDITFATSSISGDTVIASGENNNDQWSDFQIVSVSSAMARDLTVIHSGRTVELKADGSASKDLSGTTAGGEWSFKTKLSASEKADSTKIPQELQIKAVIKPSNP
ncbi:hypothetical protein [Dyadobacter sp. NIV53]|uniref:hypothetical protein n=1 Tax=Dyadobacter sp. NIV53 TaxID=2861765 RepID=UPI001C86F663|nr:hypothetical protein [Dyadobacter sp. NIV53]